MHHARWATKVLAAALTMAAWGSATPAAAQFTCLPTCNTSPNDAKFLAIAGDGLATLSDRDLEFEIIVPAGTSSFTVGIFDGDSGSTAGGATRWDLGPERLFTYSLFADPEATGTGAAPVDLLPGMPVVTSSSMDNNAWTDFTVATSAAAMAPSGNFFYRLLIEGPATGGGVFLNAFKIRTSAVLTIELANQPFSYIGAGTNIPDLMEIYPDGTVESTTYDGTFRFFMDVPEAQTSIEVFDGDLDHGNFDGTSADTDDPNASGVPPFSTPDAVPEGVAVGTGSSTGDPPDNVDNPFFARGGPVTYQMRFPDGQIHENANPSGNREWERYFGSVSGVDADFIPSAIPAGRYEIRILGNDLFNLNALRLPFRLICVDVFGDACEVPRPFLVGDLVFLDVDDSGDFTAGDAPIEGVVVRLIDGEGKVVGTATTDGAGHYAFEVEQGTFTVEIDAANFGPGGALEDLMSTTGGESQANTVIDDNVLTYDFGYKADPTLLCTPGNVRDNFSSGFDGQDGSIDWVGSWLENDPQSGGAGPGAGQVQVIANGFLRLDDAPDTGGEPSISREVDLSGATSAVLTFSFDTSHGVDRNDAVTVEVSDDGGATYATLEVITGISGEVWDARSFDISAFASPQTRVRFRVSDLYGGSNEYFYLDYVDVTYACDGEPTPRGSIGDTVWNDANGNGSQDDPGSGLPGVAVKLLDDAGNILRMDTTDARGAYRFDGLVAGVYTVMVDETTLPDDVTEATFDLDGIATPGQAEVALGVGADRDDVDFGYRAPEMCPTCIDYVGWLNEGQYDVQPNGKYYWADAGRHRAWMHADAGTDFDLYLYRWDGRRWRQVAASYNDGTSDEHIDYQGSAGYYLWYIVAYSGSGEYMVWLDMP